MPDHERFCQALTRVYLQSPAQVLPNALWKTLAQVEGCQTDIAYDASGHITHLEASQGSRLLVYWDQERSLFSPTTVPTNSLTCALLHQDFLTGFPTSSFPSQSAYFRLIFQGSPRSPQLPAGFSFRTTDAGSESAAIASLIGQCYDDLAPSPETVSGWARSPVFAPWLWVWVWDDADDCPAGLGIAELDQAIGEGSLEWIQLLPSYRGLGLGQALVLELLGRLQGRSQFVTVPGEMENRSNPERLYRACGFTGQDVWWVLRR